MTKRKDVYVGDLIKSDSKRSTIASILMIRVLLSVCSHGLSSYEMICVVYNGRMLKYISTYTMMIFQVLTVTCMKLTIF
jgi:uncharacterized membrane protein